jgi:hypothetical protein
VKRTHLPLNGLRVLDAAARHLSFTRAVLADHVIAALHVPGRRRQRTSRDIIEARARLDHRLLADDAFALYAVPRAAPVGDHPMPGEQLHRDRAFVLDANMIRPEPAPALWFGLLGQVGDGDADHDAASLGFVGEQRLHHRVAHSPACRNA